MINTLWPARNDRSYRTYCDSSNPFDPSQIRDLMPSMQAHWPNLTCPPTNGVSLWRHQWNTHGTCAEMVFNHQHKYFQTALELKNKFNVLLVLNQADDGLYSPHEITQAIAQGIGGLAGLECNIILGNTQLLQIYLCFDKTASKIIDCPYVITNRCSWVDKVKFPVF